MSHFTVLVVGEDVDTALAPYHEYECTGRMDEYVKFVPVDMEKAKKDMEEHNEWAKKYNVENDADYTVYEDLTSYLEADGYDCVDGQWGNHTNPNAKWDWYQVGGRWSDSLVTTAGEPCNSCLKKQLDIEAMEKPHKDRASKHWHLWHGDEIKSIEGDDERRRAFCEKLGNPFISKGQIKQIAELSHDEYVECEGAFFTFAVCWDGKWYESGEMGWWAIVTDENPNWTGQFKQLLLEIPDDALVTVVDCHI